MGNDDSSLELQEFAENEAEEIGEEIEQEVNELLEEEVEVVSSYASDLRAHFVTEDLPTETLQTIEDSEDMHVQAVTKVQHDDRTEHQFVAVLDLCNSLPIISKSHAHD
jgi:nitrogenase molybdenum-iron protein alpha/beta subunit